MKEIRNDIITVTALSFFGGVLLTLTIVSVLQMQNDLKQAENNTEFVWNDDEESIPADGSLVKVEYSEGNTIYLGPNE